MNVSSFKRNLLVALPISLFALSSVASATTITGTAAIGGSGGTGVTVTGNTITFNGGGAFIEQNPGMGSFSGVTGGTLKNLSGPPLVGAISVVKFATFIGGMVTPIYFDLTSIDLGTGSANCSGPTANNIGNTCTPGVSPFTLTQKSGSVSVDFTFHGVSYDSTGTPLSPTDAFLGTSLTFQGVNITTLLAQLGTPGGSISSSYQGSFSAVPPTITPEPSAASLLFMGVALIAGSGAIRKYRQNS